MAIICNYQADESVDLLPIDVNFQEFSIVMKQGCENESSRCVCWQLEWDSKFTASACFFLPVMVSSARIS